MPIYNVPLPDGQTVRLVGPEGATAEELAQAVEQITAQSARPVPEETRPDYGFGKTASKAFSRGKKRVASTFGDVIPAMVASSLGFDEYAEKQLKEAETSEQIIQEKYRPQFESFKEVSGPIEALKFATETVAEQIPNIATTLIPGAGAGAVATRLGAAKLTAAELAKRQAAAQGVGVYLGSYALNAPEVFQNVYQETGELATGASLIFGAAAASLDSILPAAVLRSITPLQKAGIAKAVLKQSGMRPGLTERIFKEGLKAVGAEGLTEGAQEAISISAENFVGNNPQIFQSEDWERIMESSVRGAIAGGFLGGVAGSLSGPAREKPAEPTQTKRTPSSTTDEVEAIGGLDVTEPEINQTPVGAEPIGESAGVLGTPDTGDAGGTGAPIGEGLGPTPTTVSEPEGREGVSPAPLTAQQLWDNLKTDTPYDTLSGTTKDVVDIAAEQDLLDPSTEAGKDSIKKIKGLIKQDKELPQQLEALAKKEPKEEEVATVPPVEPPAEQAPVALEETAEETWAAMSDIPFKELSSESQDLVQQYHGTNQLTGTLVDEIEARHKKNKINEKMSEKFKVSNDIDTTPEANVTLESRAEPVDTGNTSELVSGELTQEFGPNVDRMQERGRLQIVNSVEELPDTVKMSETANGAFDPNTQTSYIVANRVPAGQARRVLLHEVGEHYGLEKMVGKDYMAILNRVKSLKNTNKQVKEIYDEVEALYPELTPGSKPFLQEVVAKLGEQAPNNTVMRRLIGAVKNFLRRLGLYDVNKFSDIDIQDMILNSLRASLKETTGREQVSGPALTGGYQPLQYSKNFGFADSVIEKMPLPSKDYIQGVWDKILQLPTTVRKTWMGMLGLQAMADLYGKFLPSIQKLINVLEQRAANVETTRAEVDVLGNLGMDIIQGKKRKLIKYNAKEVKLTLNKDGSVAMNDQTTKVKYTDKQLQDWDTTVYELSRQNIDPRDQDAKNQAEPLVEKFRRLPAELQALAIAFTTKYEQYGDSLIKAFVKNVGTDPAAQAQANIVIKEFQNNRLKFYHPFRRQGDYRLEYVSKADLQNYEASIENVTDEKALAEAERAYQQLKTVKRFETKNEYLRALQELQANDTLELLNGGVDPVSQRGDMTVGAVQVMDKVVAVLSKKDATTNEQKVDPKTVEQVRQIFLDLLPAQSIKQQTRRRVGTKGEIQDLVGGFIDLGARMATQIANLDYIPQIDQTINEIKQERAVAREATLADTTMTNEQKTRLDESLAYAVEEISGPAARSFFHNPVAGPVSSRFAYLSYMTTIAGNVSSAIVNASQLAIVVYPALVAKYGFTSANKAIGQAFRYYFGGGKDSNRGFLPDHSFGMKNGKLNEALPDDIKQLYEQGIRNTVFRRGVGYELTEMRKTNAKDFIGMKAKFDALMGWMFQNTERMNREVTYLAGYLAAKEKGDSFVNAEAYARDLTRRSHGTALPEIGPRYFQSGFGKVMFTFKRYGHAMMHLLIKGMYDAYKGETKEVRNMARKQILGIYGASFTFAGLQGVPLYGATQVVAESLYALLGDDDEPFDFEESTREIFGDIGYRGPLNKILNLDIASRTGFANLIWREDPRRVSEVGVLQYAAEQTLGPSFSYFLNVNRGLGDMSNGNMYRGLEQMLPAFLRNPMKAVRYGTEGALTRKGAELTELNGLDAFLQVFGFTNEDLSLQYARNQSMKAAERSFNARRSGLLTAHFLARQNGDMEMLREIDGKISDFNRSTLGRSNPITSDTLTRSFRERLRSIEESTNGITLSKRTADVIKKEYGS
jgi:hypothetical protein